MKKVKSVLALLLVVGLLGGVLAGCNQEGGQNEAKAALELAQEKFAQVQSMTYEVEMIMNLSMSALGQKQEINTTTIGVASYVVDPMQAKIEMSMDMGELGAQAIVMYMQQDGDQFTTYTSMDDGDTWTKATVEADEIAQYNGKESMKLYLDNIDQFQKGQTGTVNGKAVTEYVGVLKEDAFNEAFAAAGLEEQFAAMGLDDSAAQDLYKDLGAMPVSIWIEDETGLPVKYVMDMTEMMQALMTRMMESLLGDTISVDIEVTEVLMTMIVTGVDNVTEILVPDEAKAA